MDTSRLPPAPPAALRTATRFVLLLGVVSLFADMTHESARSINGPFLAGLGRSSVTIGWVAGTGELLGYGLRSVAGYFADKTQRYWLITFVGYALNMACVPLLALAGYWPLAVGLMVAERVGRAIRTPARDAMLAHGTQLIGRGWGFGISQALDQLGATLGPLLVAAVLRYHPRDYPLAYGLLAGPAVLTLLALAVAHRQYPHPEQLEAPVAAPMGASPAGYPRRFWAYLLAANLVAAAYVDFPLIALHFAQRHVLASATIPVYYAVAMGSDALASLGLGRLFDRRGPVAVTVGVLAGVLFAPLVFWGGPAAALGGMVLWGIGLAAQESVLKAEVARLLPPARRAQAFGLFDTGFGVAWFAGSVALGYLYDYSLAGLVAFSVLGQVLGVALFTWLGRRPAAGAALEGV